MSTKYKIHPAIGIARLGDSPDEFYLAPETPASLPVACDDQGNALVSPDGESEVPIGSFKDARGRIKRQGARFQVYAYDDESPEGRPLTVGDEVAGGGNHGTLVDIQWRVYLANKKASWYEFEQLEGEHGYAPDHRLRNPDVEGDARQRLVIDPGPRIVDGSDRRRARFDRSGNDVYAATFPPRLEPCDVDTLGELRTDDDGRLVVLGGHGRSGTSKYDEFGQPRIDHYANNDGWFDDTSDGPVMARLVMHDERVDQLRFIDVEMPAWVVVGYPAYVPQVLDMVTMEDVVEDLSIRLFATRTDLYGTAGTFDDPQRIDPNDTEELILWRSGRLTWNDDYRPWFYRDIWPILFRPDEFTYLTDVLAQSNYPHNQSKRGNFDPERLGLPPVVDKNALLGCHGHCLREARSGRLLVDALAPDLVFLERRALAELVHCPPDGGDAPDAAERGKDLRRALRQGREELEEILGNAAAEWASGLDLELGDTFAAELEKRKIETAEEKDAEPEEAEAVADDLLARHETAFHAVLGRWEKRAAAREGEPAEAENRLDDALEEALDALHRRLHAAGGKKPGDDQASDNAIHGVLRPLRQALSQRLGEFRTGALLRRRLERETEKHTYDPFRSYRNFLFDLLRKPGEENQFAVEGQATSRVHDLPLMPLLAGDNPISNTLPSKFLRLTDYQYFLLRQWARGLFVNEKLEGWSCPDPWTPYAGWKNRTGRDLDRGVLSNLLGGAFCPGGEVGWVLRNPSIYEEPWRLKADPDFYAFRQTAAQANQNRGGVPERDYSSYSGVDLALENDFDRGLQPGDLTKYMALPWQADFNECTLQDIDVTYATWNDIYPESDDDSLLARQQRVWETLWWPAHRPLQTFEPKGWQDGKPTGYAILDWSRGVPQTNAGDLKMVTEWKRLGFVIQNPYGDYLEPTDSPPVPKYISVERNPDPPADACSETDRSEKGES